MQFLLIILHLFVICYSVPWAKGDKKFVCEVGVSYRENSCNHCLCTPGGDLSLCTRMACYGEDYAKLKNCKIGETHQSECNKCFCVEKYGTICTTKKC